MLSAFLACLMIVSSVPLQVQAAEPSAEVTQLQENTTGQPGEPGTETPGQPEETQREIPGQPEGTETETPGQSEDPEQQESPGTEEGDDQTAGPDTEDDEGQSGDPGTENGGEQTDGSEQPDGDGQPDTEDGEDRKDTEEDPENPDGQEEDGTDLPAESGAVKPKKRAATAGGEEDTAAAAGLQVEKHTQEEIKEFIKQSGATTADKVTYAENPVAEAPYKAGKLSDETQASAIAMLNQIRYIAGLSYDVALDESYAVCSQAVALVNYVNGKLDHYPEKPENMDEQLYQSAETGGYNSNLTYASWERTLNSSLINAWMYDGDASNIATLGHRRWVINPSMQKAGFGSVSGSKGTYSAMYAHDVSGSGGNLFGVAWPAQNMPVSYFSTGHPWSVSLGETVNADEIAVKLTRKSDNKVWNFDSSSSADGYFGVDNQGYGETGCIIFRPSDITGYAAGDSFHVEIMKNGEGYVDYTVDFFDVPTDGEGTDEPENPDSSKLILWDVTMEDKVYDGKAAAYTGMSILKDASGNIVHGTFILTPYYEGTLADGTPYRKQKGPGPSQAGEYTLTFSLTGEDAGKYTLEEAAYPFQITKKEVTVTADSVTAVIGRQLPAVSALTYQTEGLVEGEALLTPPSLRYSPENISTDAAGSYEIVPSGADAGANYSITYVNGTLKVEAEEILYSGTTNNISWKIDQGGKLTIEGMGDYECTYAYTDAYGRNYNLPPWCEYRDTIKSAEVKVTGIAATKDMFRGCSSLQSLDVSGLNTGNVTDMSNMFSECSSLQSLDVSGLNTGNVTNMNGMFSGCSSLESLDVSGLNTGNVTNMGGMFSGCSGLESLNVSSLNTGNVTSMSGMFGECSSLKILEGLDNWETSNVVNMMCMFEGCSSLESLDLSGWDAGKVSRYNYDPVNAEAEFPYSETNQFLSGCDSLKCIRTPRKIMGGINNTPNGGIALPLTADGGLWYDDSGMAHKTLNGMDESITLTRKKLNAGKIKDISWEIDENGRLTISGTGEYLFDARQEVEDFSLWDKEDMPPWSNRSDVLSAVVNVSGIRLTGKMFYGCSKLNSVDLSGLDAGEVTDMSGMFSGCSGLKTLNLNGLDTGNVTNMSGMFSSCSGLETLDLSGLDLGNVTNMKNIFSGCSSLRTLNLNGLDTGNVIDMSGMFSSCSGLEMLDLSGLDLGNVTNIENIFSGCSNLKTLNLNGVDMGNVTSMSYMFDGCSSLETLDLNGLNTGNVTSMSDMFRDCSSLKTLNLNGLDTGNVTSMSGMFLSCSSLRTLNLSGLDMGNVTDMSGMFRGCISLETLDLSGLDTGNVTDMSYMFDSCISLKTLNLSGLDTSNVTNMYYMFMGCRKLQALDLGSFDCSSMELSHPVLSLNCESLSYIKTPGNLSCELWLPTDSKWHDKNGTEYVSTEPLSGLKESIELYREGGSGSGQEQYVYVSGITVKSRPYDGSALAYTGTPEVTDASGNPVSGVTLTATYTGTLVDGSEYPATAQAPSQAGNYTLSFAISGTGEETYILWNSAYDFQISRRQVTITAPDRAIEVGGQLPDLSATADYTVDGLLTGEQLLKAPAFKYKKTNISTQKPGSYEIIPYGAEAGMNHRIKYVKGQLTVGTMNGYDLSEAEIVFSDIEYGGYGHNYVVDPVVRYRDWTLREGIDFELTLTGTANGYNKFKGYWYVHQEGQYTIQIKGIGFYHGEQTKTFLVGPKGGYGDILPEDRPGYVSDSGIWIAGISEDGYTYTGKAIKPVVRVYNHTTLLKEKTDYTISYANNVKANVTPSGEWLENVSATPVIKITGKGNYSGTTEEYFEIRQDDISMSAERWDTSAVTVAYTGKPQKPQPVIREFFGRAQLKNSNYTIAYYQKNDEQRANPLSSVQEEGEYVIRCTGKGNYAGVAECSLTVTKLKLVGKLKVSKIPDQPYTGEEIRPLDDPEMMKYFTVKDGGKLLEKDVDYSIEDYYYNIEAGTGEVWIEGIPEAGYAGERRITFKITGTPIRKAVVTGLAASVYNGKPQMPELRLTIEKTVNGEQTTIDLKEGIYNDDYDYYEDGDYRLSWQKNENAGTATVTIKGVGGYTGTVKKTFKIGKYDIAKNEGGKFTASLEETSFPYEKGGVKAKPVVTFQAGDGSLLTLTEGKDYTLSYKQHTGLTKEGRRAEITVKGKGNFSGTYQSKLYHEIVPQDIGKLTLTAQDKVWKNKKNIYATKVAVTDVNGKALKTGTDYDKTFTYTYANDTEVQDASANGAAVNRHAGDTVEQNDIIPVGAVLKVKVTAKEGSCYMGSLEGEYRITKASIASAKVTVPVQEYTGKPVTLDGEEITVKIGGETLMCSQNGQDGQWEIVPDSYKNNVKKGTASVTIRGLGDYGGTKTVRFKIRAQSFPSWQD